ncbi:MAG: Abi family protein [Verrucomicrobia bacterium]|nr:Abi family protein [Verrucomicrobiota bacterium]
MKYAKPPLTYEQQADLLIQRGLTVNRDLLIKRLQAVNYYRLSAYCRPFKQADNTFKPGTTFDTVWQRYTFDRQFRLLVMDAIERVEIAIRSRLVYELVHRYGTFAQLDFRAFPGIPPVEHRRLLDELHENALKSSEAFVGHFRRTYDEFPDIPLWAAAETMTFGQMFTMFRRSEMHVQRAIATGYGIKGKVLLSWLLTLNYVRNLCAHHARLWNRELAIKPLIPYERHDPRWHAPSPVDNHRIFVVITLLHYLMGRVAPQSHWRQRLYDLFDRYPEIPLAAMGIPGDWKNHPLWVS